MILTNQKMIYPNENIIRHCFAQFVSMTLAPISLQQTQKIHRTIFRESLSHIVVLYLKKKIFKPDVTNSPFVIS